MFMWKEGYTSGISEIDRQHKKLFEIGSRIYDIASLDDGLDHYDEIKAIMNELVDYTEYHFNYEEELMQKYGYGGYDEQKIEHTFFVKKLKKLCEIDIDENQRNSIMSLISFTADWIASHILKSDAKYWPFFAERGVR